MGPCEWEASLVYIVVSISCKIVTVHPAGSFFNLVDKQFKIGSPRN